MLEEYDIDKLNPRKNPYAKKLKKQVMNPMAKARGFMAKMIKHKKMPPASAGGTGEPTERPSHPTAEKHL